MNDFFTYIFWPNPGNASYDSPKALALLIFCAVLVVGSFALSAWRKRQGNQLMRRLSKSWPTAAFWFGLLGLLFVVARVEQIQFIAMRFMWVLWGIGAVIYIVFQLRKYRTRYYEVLPATSVEDPRSRYLPKRKRR